MIILTILLLVLAWSLYAGVNLTLNVKRARAIGVPIITLPISPTNILWIIFEPLVFRILDVCPFEAKSFKHYARRGWHFIDKSSTHVRVGDAFTLVTSGEIFLHICDPDAINEIFSRRQDFVRPLKFYKMLAIFGPNIVTVEWSNWQRVRKIIATAFNDRINQAVWAESWSRTQKLVEVWTRFDRPLDLEKDAQTFSLDVLAAVGIGGISSESEKIEARKYRQSLAIIMENVMTLMLVPPRLLTLPFMPKSFTKIGHAADNFKQHMMDIINTERRLLDDGKTGTGALVTGLVSRASEDEHTEADFQHPNRDGGSMRGLTMSEILGNIFFINLAGHETTATTLAYMILLLAAYPEVQDWVGEELESVCNSSTHTSDYGLLFPRLKRCQAVILETLRLYPPIPGLTKYTSNKPTTLVVGGKPLHIPAHTMVVTSLLALHTHPKYWPEDPLAWNPFRWISVPADVDVSKIPTSKRLENERLFEPAKGTYFPWSYGAHTCPGKKFAQVELTAALAALLRFHRVHPLDNEAGNVYEARKKILACCEDSGQVVLLKMRNPNNIKLMWKDIETKVWEN